MRVAFLGLGIMGWPMAANLVKAGHEVTVWNRTPKEVPGAATAATAADAVRGKEAVWICVSDTKAVQTVLWGPQGAHEGLNSGTVVVDSSTISPSASLQFMQGLQEAKGCEFLDAPVTGSKIAAESGQLIFMVGGNPANIERTEPLFRAMGKKVIHMGDNGKGLAAKLAQNMNIVFIYEGLCESLTLARKLGVPVEKMFELIEASMIRSGVAEYKKPFILAQDFSPNFPLKLMHKDMHLMMDAAKEYDVKLPGLTKIDEIYEEASRMGFDDLDYAVTITLLEEMAGLRQKAKSS